MVKLDNINKQTNKPTKVYQLMNNTYVEYKSISTMYVEYGV